MQLFNSPSEVAYFAIAIRRESFAGWSEINHNGIVIVSFNRRRCSVCIFDAVTRKQKLDRWLRQEAVLLCCCCSCCDPQQCNMCVCLLLPLYKQMVSNRLTALILLPSLNLIMLSGLSSVMKPNPPSWIWLPMQLIRSTLTKSHRRVVILL
jgi:hypothetical protein